MMQSVQKLIKFMLRMIESMKKLLVTEFIFIDLNQLIIGDNSEGSDGSDSDCDQ